MLFFKVKLSVVHIFEDRVRINKMAGESNSSQS